jgi:hypothetical protein
MRRPATIDARLPGFGTRYRPIVATNAEVSGRLGPGREVRRACPIPQWARRPARLRPVRASGGRAMSCAVPPVGEGEPGAGRQVTVGSTRITQAGDPRRDMKPMPRSDNQPGPPPGSAAGAPSDAGCNTMNGTGGGRPAPAASRRAAAGTVAAYAAAIVAFAYALVSPVLGRGRAGPHQHGWRIRAAVRRPGRGRPPAGSPGGGEGGRRPARGPHVITRGMPISGLHRIAVGKGVSPRVAAVWPAALGSLSLSDQSRHDRVKSEGPGRLLLGVQAARPAWRARSLIAVS